MAKVLTNAQKDMVTAIDHDGTLNAHERAEKLTALYRSFGAPYDRVVFRANGARIRAILGKRTAGGRVGSTRDDDDGGEVPV